MTERALVFDVDGVLITGHREKGGWWHVDMEADLGLDPDLFQSMFFTGQWADIVCGRLDIEQPLAATLSEIAPHLTVEQLLDYWFSTDARLNTDLLNALDNVRSHESVSLHLATNQEHRRARYIWEVLGLSSRFDHLHYSGDIGHAKPDHAFFRAVEERTGLPPEAHVFFDDQEKNVAAARACGWTASHWTEGMASPDFVTR